MADAVNDDVVLVARGIGAKHDFEAVVEADARCVDGHGADREQAVVDRIEPARLRVEDDPSLVRPRARGQCPAAASRAASGQGSRIVHFQALLQLAHLPQRFLQDSQVEVGQAGPRKQVRVGARAAGLPQRAGAVCATAAAAGSRTRRTSCGCRHRRCPSGCLPAAGDRPCRSRQHPWPARKFVRHR